MLEIALFGEPAFCVDGKPHAFVAPPKALPLLVYLLLHRNAPAARETLAGTFWPDDDEETARGNLRRHLHYIRKALPPGEWLTVDRKSVRWNAELPHRLDVAEFEQQSKIVATRPLAAALYRGDLYPSCDEEWLYFERERLRNMQIGNLATLAQQSERTLDPVAASSYARQLLETEPWREDAVRILMRARMQAGDRAGALAEYERFRARLLDEMGIEPMRETNELFEAFACEEDRAPVRASRASALVGRNGELEALLVQWRATTNGRGAVVLVGGEAGVGKTALLRELEREVTESGGAVLSAKVQSQGNAPYGALLAALEQAKVDKTLRKSVMSASAAVLADTAARGAFFASVATALRSLAERAPVLLRIDDLQWIDGDSVALIEFLERRLRDVPVLIAASYREDAIGQEHPVRALRRSLSTRPNFGHVALNALSFGETVQVARRRLGESPAEQTLQELYRRSQGNPFFVIELLESVAAGRDTDVPDTIRDLVDERYEGLSPASRELIAFLAAFNAPVTAEVLSALPHSLESDRRVLDELVEARFLREERGLVASGYVFVHDVVRESIYESLSSEKRRTLHAAAAETIERVDPSKVAALAFHHESAQNARAAAAAYVKAAAQALGAFANDEGERFARKAIALDSDSHTTMQALMHLNAVYDRRGQHAFQMQVLDEMERVAKHSSDPEHLLDAIFRRCVQAFEESDMHELRRQVERLRDIAPDEPVWRARLEAFSGCMEALCGDVGAAWNRLELAARICREEHRDFGELFCYVRLLEICERNPRAFEPLLEESRSLERRLDSPDATFALASAEANLFLHVDRTRCAHAALRIIEAGERAGDQIYVGVGHMYLGAVAAYRFEPSAAQAHFAAAHAALDDSERRADLARLWRLHGLYDFGIGDVEAGIADSLKSLTFARDARTQDLVAFAAANAIYGYVLLGRLDEAELLVSRELAQIENLPQNYFSMHHLMHAQGLLLDAQGKSDEAVHLMVRAREKFEERGHKLHAVWIGTLLANVLLRAGRVDEALHHIEAYLAHLPDVVDEGWMPQETLWYSAQVMRASGNADRARDLASRAAGVVATRSAALSDPEQQQRFLRLAVNRDILRAHTENVWPVYRVKTMS